MGLPVQSSGCGTLRSEPRRSEVRIRTPREAHQALLREAHQFSHQNEGPKKPPQGQILAFYSCEHLCCAGSRETLKETPRRTPLLCARINENTATSHSWDTGTSPLEPCSGSGDKAENETRHTRAPLRGETEKPGSEHLQEYVGKASRGVSFQTGTSGLRPQRLEATSTKRWQVPWGIQAPATTLTRLAFLH